MYSPVRTILPVVSIAALGLSACSFNSSNSPSSAVEQRDYATHTPSSTPSPVSSTQIKKIRVTKGTGKNKLPDLAIRELDRFSVAATDERKLLKFPVVTTNIGTGPLEVNAIRPNVDSVDWATHQTIYHVNGTKTVLPKSKSQFYFAGDEHRHWHFKDFDLYELHDATGTKLQIGEKHGFCLEDNTSYRDWPSTGKNGSPKKAVYSENKTKACGDGLPLALYIQHGLSVGWGDTYPVSLPDQFINITGLPDGVYTVKVTANWQQMIREANYQNNSAVAKIQITGTTVKVISSKSSA